MKNQSLIIAVILCAALFQPLLRAADVSVNPPEMKEQRDARMGWWREARFGLFIHWGVYSVPAGISHGVPVTSFYKGKPSVPLGEWIMYHAKIPVAEYKDFAKQFTAEKFDPAMIVRAAKAAGMEYIVFTTKHHDGFAMFDTKVNDWSIVRSSPYGKDPLKALADECRKQGIRLGFYYSQAQDWVNKGAAWHHAKWDKAQEGSMDDYIEKTCIPQLRELLSNYGPDTPAVVWWDTPHDITQEQAARIEGVVQELRPGLIQNNRLGGGFTGDTETPEQYIPDGGYPGRDWESCMTMNDTWGFKKDDHNWKSAPAILFNLIDVVSKGGNFLLNIGPDARGVVPQPSLDCLDVLAKWMKVNSESIHGAGNSCFGQEYGGAAKEIDGYGVERKSNGSKAWRCTTKKGKIYLHIFQWPGDQFEFVGVKTKVTKAYLLADRGRSLPVSQSGTKVSLGLPKNAPDAIASVVCLETEDVQ